MPNHNAKSIFIDSFIPADILDITNKLKQKTSYGADGISTKLLMKTTDTIIFPITRIVNLTFETGIFTTYLKCAKVIPIYKAGDPSSLNNYRPISLLSSISKILERTMCSILGYLCILRRGVWVPLEYWITSQKLLFSNWRVQFYI